MEMKLELVVVPVSDVDRAKHFYAEQVGFVVDHDTRASDRVRIVQLTPPGSACSIAIGSGMINNAEAGTLKGLQLVVDDIDAVRSQLAARGVEVSAVQHVDNNGQWLGGHGGPWNSFVFFSDPDGNSWTIQEKPK
jgi:catechol 2,3-dioxygenase-like lactoylglutathione lyase family enzyme